MVRNLIVISTAAERDGWFPENLKAMEAVSSAQADRMKQTPIYTRYAEVAPHSDQFPLLLDRMGELMAKEYDWRPKSLSCLCRRCVVRRSRRRLDETHSGVLRFVWRRCAGSWLGVYAEICPSPARHRAGVYTLQFRPGARYRPRDRRLSDKPNLQGDPILGRVGRSGRSGPSATVRLPAVRQSSARMCQRGQQVNLAISPRQHAGKGVERPRAGARTKLLEWTNEGAILSRSQCTLYPAVANRLPSPHPFKSCQYLKH
jgi:hypothetical protein